MPNHKRDIEPIARSASEGWPSGQNPIDENPIGGDPVDVDPSDEEPSEEDPSDKDPLDENPSDEDPVNVERIDVTYIFVWNEVDHEEPRGSESESWVRIRSTNEWPDAEDAYQCSASFSWGSFKANFTCEYYPSSTSFSVLQFVENTTTTTGQLFPHEILIDFEISAFESDCFGPVVADEAGEIMDANGNAFMLVNFKSGFIGGAEQCGHSFAKRALPEERWNDVDLSRAERTRLDIYEGEWRRYH